MIHTYFLQTARIGFSTQKADDIKLATLLWGDPKVTRFICASGHFTEDDIKKRLTTEVTNQEAFHIQYWPIFTLSTNELIGCCGLRPFAKNEYEIGFHLRPAFWRQGYATEAATAVIQYAFTSLHATRIIAGHHPDNDGSRKILPRLGFQSIEEHFYEPTGLYHPSYELLVPITN